MRPPATELLALQRDLLEHFTGLRFLFSTEVARGQAWHHPLPDEPDTYYIHPLDVPDFLGAIVGQPD